MASHLLLLLTLLAAVGSGLIGGVFFAFSNFVMPALARRPPAEGVAAMQAINVVVLNGGFLGIFAGTVPVGLAAAGLALAGGRPGAWLSAAAALLYTAGCFGVTMRLNVPLNERLATTAADSAEGAALWALYLRDWTRWNSVRTSASLAAALLFTFALRAG